MPNLTGLTRVASNIYRNSEGLYKAVVLTSTGPVRCLLSEAERDRDLLKIGKQPRKGAICSSAPQAGPCGYIAVIPCTRYQAVSGCIKMLSEVGFRRKSIVLFASNDTVASALRHTYGERATVAVGKRGLMPQRSCIDNFFPANTLLLSVDDDVSYLQRKEKGKSVKCTAADIRKLLKRSIADMKKHSANLWGLNASTSPRNMTQYDDEPGVSCGCVNGGLFGCHTIRTRAPGKLDIKVADDAARTLKYFKRDGVVLRYRGFALPSGAFERNSSAAASATRSAESSSSSVTRSLGSRSKRKRLEEKASKQLASLYPDLASYDKNRSGGRRLAWSQKRTKSSRG